MNEPVEIGSKPEISSFKKTLIYWHKTKLTLSWKTKKLMGGMLFLSSSVSRHHDNKKFFKMGIFTPPL